MQCYFDLAFIYTFYNCVFFVRKFDVLQILLAVLDFHRVWNKTGSTDCGLVTLIDFSATHELHLVMRAD